MGHTGQQRSFRGKQWSYRVKRCPYGVVQDQHESFGVNRGHSGLNKGCWSSTGVIRGQQGSKANEVQWGVFGVNVV